MKKRQSNYSWQKRIDSLPLPFSYSSTSSPTHRKRNLFADAAILELAQGVALDKVIQAPALPKENVWEDGRNDNLTAWAWTAEGKTVKVVHLLLTYYFIHSFYSLRPQLSHLFMY